MSKKSFSNHILKDGEGASKSMPIRLVYASSFGLLGVLMLGWCVVSGSPPPFLVSSALIVVLIIFVVLRHGLVSVPTLIVIACFVPALSFAWAWINGASYINMLNHWLQDDQFYVNKTVYLATAALCFTVATLFTVSATRLKRVQIVRSGQALSGEMYVLACLGTLFFVWLTEPTFSTIISMGSEIVKTGNFEGTQFAGAMAVLCWLPAFVTYASRWREGTNTSKAHAITTGDRLFVVTTVLALAWLILHARRNELIGMGIILLLVLRETKGIRQAVILGIVFALILFVLGKLRTFGMLAYLGTLGGTATDRVDNVVSLPGGASNVFLTFVDTTHYFSAHAFLFGETFYNYVMQILPSFVYNLLQLDRPPYFYQQVMSGNYDYNGGTYVGAVFYGNFGILGMALFGIFVGVFIIIAARAISSRKMGVQLIGLYMVAFTFRGFWYEMITLIKPIVIVLLPACIAFAALTRSKVQRGYSLS